MTDISPLKPFKQEYNQLLFPFNSIHANFPFRENEVPMSFMMYFFFVEIPASEVVKKKIIQNEMSKAFFIFSASPKEKYYWLREPYLYQNLG